MAAIASRQDLKDYALRRLGYPVIEINIEDTQMDDAIDDAFQFYRLYDSDSYQRTYVKRQVTANEITVSGVTGIFQKDEWVSSSVTGSTFQVYDVALPLIRTVDITNGNLQAGEVLTGQISGAVATVVSVALSDVQNGYITLPDNIVSVTKLLPWSQVNSSMNSLWNIQYQIRLNDLYALTNSDMVYYTQTMQHLSLMEQTLVAEPQIRFNQHSGRVYIDSNIAQKVSPDGWIILECYGLLDPDTFTRMYNSYSLKRLTVAYFKRIWGSNLSKFSDIVLVGGVKLRGGAIYAEAVEEAAMVEEEIRSTFEIGPNFLVG
jgi:hypothetical protein